MWIFVLFVSLASVLKDRFGSPDAARAKDSSPKYIYINPSGANPTGTVIPEERKKQIYKVITCD
jgi:DNA-binding transcriptional MocR family regulator